MVAIWRTVMRGVRALADRRGTDGEIDEEVAHYVEEATHAHRARGLDPAAARRAALLEVGGATQVREDVRGHGWESTVEAFVADVRYALRQLRSAPGFSVVALLTLALGIGATTAIYSAVKPVLFDTLPYPDADRIRVIREVTGDGMRDGTFGVYTGLAERSRTFASIAVLLTWQPTMIGAAHAERLEGQRVSASYFGVLGVAPGLGRDFAAAEDARDGGDVVIVSDALWRRRFGADPAILGRAVRLDDRDFTVVGVMPAGFENVPAPAAELWAPLQYDISEGRAWGHHLRTIGRLHPGAEPDEAARELTAIGVAAAEAHGAASYALDVAWVTPSLQDDVTRAVRPALLAILGGVFLVLVMACVNVTNLLLARGVRRRGEFALRAALGAGRGRMMRQLLTESLLLAAAGGALGLAVAHAGVRALVALAPEGLPRAAAIGVDGGVFLFGVCITALIGVAFGVAPAVQCAGQDQQELQRASRQTAGRRHRRARSGLVVAQVALALVMLAGSGLLLRSVQRLFAVPAGFDAANVITMQIQTSGERLAAVDAVRHFFDNALAAASRVPGVATASLTNQLPLSGDDQQWGVHFEASPPHADDRGAFRYAVTPGYIETMRIPLRAGRTLTEQDRDGAPLVALINESFAHRHFADGDAVGQRLRIGAADSPPYTIVGVVGDVKQQSLALDRSDAVYTTTGQWRFADRAMTLVVRAHGDAAALAPALQSAIRAVDRDQPIVRVSRLDRMLAASAAERRFALILFQAFALAALLLAAAGIYGVTAGSVAERTRELGIRSALGARRADVVALVLGQGLRLTLLGAALGMIGALAASRVIGALLFGVSPLDPPTYAAVIALLGVVALAASGVPAWRAAKVDPCITLRGE